MRQPWLLMMCITCVQCLTQTELLQFGTSGDFPESYVTVDSTPTDRYLIKGSGIPDHATQSVNPNSASNQNYNVSIPRTPTDNIGLHGCLPLGMIGITRTGVAIYNPLTGDLLNAVEGSNQETFDTCDGHSSPNGAYHYHKIPDSCLYRGEEDEFIGVALDGYPIYGPNVSDSDHILTSTDLDECHGRVINGKYRYHATTTWPYFMGCFKGVVMQDLINLAYTCNLTQDSGWENQWTYYLCHCPNGNPGGGGGGMHPPPEQCRMDNPQRPPNCPFPPGNKGSSIAFQIFHIVIPILIPFY